MPNLNKVMLMGNLTRDPELRFLPSNMPVVNFGLAVNRTWYNKQTNEKQEETTFIDVEGFGKQAEIVNQYMAKGRPIFVEGRLKLDQWQDQQGNNRSKIKVIMESFQFLGGRDGGGGGGGRSGGDHQGGQGGNPSTGYQSNASSDAPHQAIADDDIPF